MLLIFVHLPDNQLFVQMKSAILYRVPLFVIMLMSCVIYAQEKAQPEMGVAMADKSSEMKTYVIERDIPDIGLSSLEDLQGASVKSCTVLGEMGEDIQWVTSYVTNNKIYCIYKAKNKELIEEHARIAGFPANSIQEVAAQFVSPQ